MLNFLFAYITCGYCDAKLQVLKQVADPADETGSTLITESDDEQLNVISQEHWAKCTQGTPWTNDTNATYE